jgi:hypothetical protein
MQAASEWTLVRRAAELKKSALLRTSWTLKEFGILTIEWAQLTILRIFARPLEQAQAGRHIHWLEPNLDFDQTAAISWVAHHDQPATTADLTPTLAAR